MVTRTYILKDEGPPSKLPSSAQITGYEGRNLKWVAEEGDKEYQLKL